MRREYFGVAFIRACMHVHVHDACQGGGSQGCYLLGRGLGCVLGGGGSRSSQLARTSGTPAVRYAAACARSAAQSSAAGSRLLAGLLRCRRHLHPTRLHPPLVPLLCCRNTNTVRLRARYRVSCARRGPRHRTWATSSAPPALLGTTMACPARSATLLPPALMSTPLAPFTRCPGECAAAGLL